MKEGRQMGGVGELQETGQRAYHPNGFVSPPEIVNCQISGGEWGRGPVTFPGPAR
jgi:hypothetical protein